MPTAWSESGVSMSPPATDPLVPPPDDLPEDFPHIQGYRISGILGEGAVGTVFRARRSDTGVPVALKVLHAVGPKRGKHIARLVKEGRVIARLNHPGIVKGLDVGESGGRYYIAMELVDGKSIRDHLEAGRIFTEDEAVEIVIKAVRALHHAVREGIVHRDIKPANLMLTCDGKVKITDLGLAKDAVDLSLTRSDATVGTPQYIAPEQARDSQAADSRSDIFSLGATLYHMVTGRPPFSGASLAEIITKVLYEAEEPVERLNPALSAPFAKLLGRMLAKDPGDRYQGYPELLADLDRVAGGRDIRGPVRRSAAEQVSGWQWVVGVLALVGAASVFFLWRPWADRRPDPVPVPPVAATGPGGPVTPPVTPPDPPRWQVELAELRGELDSRVDRGDYEGVRAGLGRARSGFLRRSAAARQAFESVELHLAQRVEAKVRKDLGARLVEVREGTIRRLAEVPEAGAFAEIHREIKTLRQRLRAMPALVSSAVSAELGEDLDRVEGFARERAEELSRMALREAREQAAAWNFAGANARVEDLRGCQVLFFYPRVGPDIETFREELSAMRKRAAAEMDAGYRAFRDGLHNRLANWRYARADEEIRGFATQVEQWERGAAREAERARHGLRQDRSDVLGIRKIWTLAEKRLRRLVRDRKPVKLAFGKERSRKLIESVAGGPHPEQIKVSFRVGSSVMERAFTDLAPEDVVDRLARTAGELEPRWVGLFLYFAAARPELHPTVARARLRLANEAFAAAGGAGPRYAGLLEGLQHELNLNEQERAKAALKLHEDAMAHFHRWEFTEARAKWAHMKDRFSKIFNRDPAYREAMALAEKSIPLEQLRRRFPGAERTHRIRETGRPLAFRLRFRLCEGQDLTGLEYARESWDLTAKGLSRIVEKQVRGLGRFPVSWGVGAKIKLNYNHRAALTVRLQADANEVLTLLCISLGGNVVGLLNLDGIPPGQRGGAAQSNQVSLWVSKVPYQRRSGFDVFKHWESRFQLPGTGTAPGADYRLMLGGQHEFTLEVDSKRKRLSFSADGKLRSTRETSRPRDLDEIEVRPWNKPIVLRELVIEGVLAR